MSPDQTVPLFSAWVPNILRVCLVFLQGCYSAMVDYFETYIYTAGALAIVVLTIEVRSAPSAPAEHLNTRCGLTAV